MAALNMQEFSKKTTIPYPYFKAENPDEAFQFMLRNLEEGEIPLCLAFNGQLYKVMSISHSAYNINKLLKICKVSVVTETGLFPINTMQEYLEGVQLWIC